MEIKMKLTSQEWNILNENIDCNNARYKTASVYCFLYNSINKSNGVLKKSFNCLHKVWNHNVKNENRTCLANFKKIVNRLVDLGLILVDKTIRKNTYILPVAIEVAEKVAEIKTTESIENTELEQVSSAFDSRLIDINTNNTINTNIEKNGHRILSKKELKHIAHRIMDGLNIAKKDFVRKVVLSKIKNMKTSVKWFGAINYIHTIIQEKLLETTITTTDIDTAIKLNLGLDCNAFDNYKDKPLQFNNFKAREYDYDDLEKKLLGWND